MAFSRADAEAVNFYPPLAQEMAISLATDTHGAPFSTAKQENVGSSFENKKYGWLPIKYSYTENVMDRYIFGEKTSILQGTSPYMVIVRRYTFEQREIILTFEPNFNIGSTRVSNIVAGRLPP